MGGGGGGGEARARRCRGADTQIAVAGNPHGGDEKDREIFIFMSFFF